MPIQPNARIIEAVLMGDRTALLSALQAGESANAKDDSNSMLTLACLQDRSDLAADLIQHGADVNSRESDGSTPLFAAASIGSAQLLTLLMKAGAGRDVQNEIGQTPLMLAARSGRVDCVQALLSHGANPRLSDHFGRNALHWAVIGGDFPDLVALLLGTGIDLRARSAEGSTAEDYARALKRNSTLSILGGSPLLPH